MYEDYLQEFIYKTAQMIANKLFGFGKSRESNNEPDESTEPNAENSNIKETDGTVENAINETESNETKDKNVEPTVAGSEDVDSGELVKSENQTTELSEEGKRKVFFHLFKF